MLLLRGSLCSVLPRRVTRLLALVYPFRLFVPQRLVCEKVPSMPKAIIRECWLCISTLALCVLLWMRSTDAMLKSMVLACRRALSFAAWLLLQDHQVQRVVIFSGRQAQHCAT